MKKLLVTLLAVSAATVLVVRPGWQDEPVLRLSTIEGETTAAPLIEPTTAAETPTTASETPPAPETQTAVPDDAPEATEEAVVPSPAPTAPATPSPEIQPTPTTTVPDEPTTTTVPPPSTTTTLPPRVPTYLEIHGNGERITSAVFEVESDPAKPWIDLMFHYQTDGTGMFSIWLAPEGSAYNSLYNPIGSSSPPMAASQWLAVPPGRFFMTVEGPAAFSVTVSELPR